MSATGSLDVVVVGAFGRSIAGAGTGRVVVIGPGVVGAGAGVVGALSARVATKPTMKRGTQMGTAASAMATMTAVTAMLALARRARSARDVGSAMVRRRRARK